MIMPLTITKLKMWKDPKYTRECVEVPPAGSWKMPTADYVSSENLRPRKGSTLTEVELPLPYLQVMDMSYLYIEVEDGMTPPNTVKLFGWITSIEEIASSSEAVRISWTVDYWRTFSGSAVFGAGTVTRCPDATYKRPYQTQPRMKMVKTRYPIFPWYSGEGYGYLLMVTTTLNNDITGFRYLHGALGAVSGTLRTPTISELYSGVIDEILGVRPSEIIGCWIYPANMIKDSFFEYSDSKTRSYTDPDNYTSTIQYTESVGLKKDTFQTGLGTATTDLISDDMQYVVGIGPYGEIQSSIPWGMKIKAPFDAVTNISPEGITMYLVTSGEDFANALSDGRFLKFDALQVPINSNEWSEYAYSYQRSYDKRMREIQRNQQTVAGFTGVTGSIVGGSIAGASSGGPVGAIAGAVAGASSSIIGTTVNYFASGMFNDELQKETDKLISNQSSTLLSNEGGTGWYKSAPVIAGLPAPWYMAVIEADSVSKAEYTAKITNDGYTVEVPVSNATSFITTGGALQIQNLMLTGNIPPAGKTYIKNILSNGVRIVENNPTGVNP